MQKETVSHHFYFIYLRVKKFWYVIQHETYDGSVDKGITWMKNGGVEEAYIVPNGDICSLLEGRKKLPDVSIAHISRGQL